MFVLIEIYLTILILAPGERVEKENIEKLELKR
jgi:hypothetical protein